MVREANTSSNSAALLNFHFSTSPPSNPSNNNERNYPNSPRSRNQQQQQQQRKQGSKNKSSSNNIRKKKDIFYLYSSPNHAFVITRCPPATATNQDQYSFQGVEAVVSWSCVRIVKCLTFAESCPICLQDGFTCARITKCGHIFCLSCLIHHVQASAVINPYSDVKCPCCAVPLHLCDVRPVILITTTTASQLSSSRRGVLTFVKLHRVKHCASPYLPQPHQPRRSSPHAAPTLNTDADAAYCKFNYVDPVHYHTLLQDNLRELNTTTTSEVEEEDPADVICKCLARDFVAQELQKAMQEAPQEQEYMQRFANPAAGIFQPQPQHLLYVASSSSTTRSRGDSIASCDSNNSRTSNSNTATSSAKKKTTTTAASSTCHSMYLDQDNDETMFYQAQDGTLCFLSAFNLKCLQEEFSTYAPPPPPGIPSQSEAAASNTEIPEQPAPPPPLTIKPPLPDVVEGRILDVERVNLNPAVRNRLRCLSHLPLYSDITFCEIALGPVLSRETKKKFSKEFNKRRQSQKMQTSAEQRAKEREQRQEQERIEQLKLRFQRIDPTDDFFIQPATNNEEMPFPMGDEFGPAISALAGNDGNASPASPPRPTSELLQEGGRLQSFSQICTRGVTVTRASDFPALGSSPTGTSSPPTNSGRKSAPTPQPWGKPKVLAAAAPHLLQPTSSTAGGDGKKKTKGKKIVLFSTGGHRGNG